MASFPSAASEVQDETTEETDAALDEANKTLSWDKVLRVPTIPTLDVTAPHASAPASPPPSSRSPLHAAAQNEGKADALP